MGYEDRFSSIWNSIEGLEIPEPAEDTICIYALGFERWTDELLKVIEKPDVVIINQAKILLTDKYFDWARFVPQSHRQRMGIHGHICIYQIFEKAYERLRIVELSLTPPMLFIPVNPIPQTKPHNIAGLFIGEGLDEDEK